MGNLSYKQKTDEKAAEELIRLTESKAYAIARALCRNEQDAKDVVQDCYMKAFSQLDRLNDPERFEPWLSSMVRNACYDLFRSSAYAKTNVFSDISSENDEGDVIELEPIDMHSTYQPEVSLDEKTKKEIVFDILAKLPDDQRAAIVCMYYEDMKISDIAREMQCSENTIKSRLNYARKKIAEEVEQYEKKYDIRLYNVAPLPLFYAWFTSTTKDMEVSMVNIMTKKAAKKIIKGTIAKHSTKALLSSQAAQTVTKTGLSTVAKVTLSATVGIGVTAGVTTAAVKVYQHHEERTHNSTTITSNETSNEELPSTLIKDEVINPVIWAVDPDEHAYDSVESMTFLSGRSTDWHEFMYGPTEYPSQWTNPGYSANVMLARCADGYTLYNYDGEELLDEHFAYIGLVPWAWENEHWPQKKLYCADEEPWDGFYDNARDRLDDGTIPMTVRELGFDYTVAEEETVLKQTADVGGPYDWEIIIDGKVYFQYDIFLESRQPGEEYVGSEDNALDNTYMPQRDRTMRVCSPDDYVTVLGGATIKNDGTICPTFHYQTVGVMVNGITAVKNEPFKKYYTGETFDRDLSKGEVANGGGLAVLNAYTGKLVTGFEYDALGVTTEGYTPVKKGDKWGLVRVSDGEVVIDCILDNISNVYAGKVYVEYEGKKGVLALNTTLGLGIEINADTLS